MTGDGVFEPPFLIDGRLREESALRHVWNECVGAGRASEALRADWQHQFAEVVDVLRFRYIRFHGVFHDDMFVYRETNGSGFDLGTRLASPVYTFSYVDKVFDFILDSGARPFVELGFMPRELATVTVDATVDDLTLLRKIVTNSAYPEAEIHITEWSTSPSSRDSIHDTLFAATFITRTYLRCATLADSISYWTFTDVFEEGGAGIGPFHGGFGLVNEAGIHKPTYHAFAMLERLGDRVLLATSDGVVTRDSETSAVSAVFFNYPDDMAMRAVGSKTSYPDTRPLAEIGPSRRIRHSIGGLEPGTTFLVEILDWEHGNVAEAHHRLGSPLNLSRAECQYLSRVADSLRRFTLTAPDTGVLDLDVDLAPWAVMSLRQSA